MQLAKPSLKFNLDSLIAVCFFISFMIPYIGYIGNGYVLPFIIFFIWLVTVIFFETDYFFEALHALAFRELELYLLSAFFLVTLYTYFFVTSTQKAFSFTLIPIIYFFLVVMDAYYFSRNISYKLFIFLVIIIILGIQAAISIPYILKSDLLVSRMYASGGLEGDVLANALKNGVGGPDLYINLCGVFFLAIGMLNKFDNKKLKILIIISLILILFSILSSSYLTPLLMLIMGGFILLFKLNWKSLKIKNIFTVFVIIIGLYIFYIAYLADSELIHPIEEKIHIIIKGDLKEDGRSDLASISINTFVNEPLFGAGVPDWGDKRFGEHSPWTDFPAHYGIIGFSPFLLFLTLLLKKNFKFYFQSSNSIYSTSCLIGCSIYIISNFIDPTIFNGSTIILLIFFYCSMFNWRNKPLANKAF